MPDASRNTSAARLFPLGPIAAIAGFVLLAGCTTVTTESFHVVNNANVEAAYIAPDADFGRYRYLLADDMGIFFPRGVNLPAAETGRIRQIFRESFLAEIEAYTIVDRPGPETLKVQASLIDLRDATAGDIPGLRSDVRDLAIPGRLVFLMELRDSESDRVLGRAADSQAAPRLGAGGGETDWSGVESAAQHWARLFREFLDRNLTGASR